MIVGFVSGTDIAVDPLRITGRYFLLIEFKL